MKSGSRIKQLLASKLSFFLLGGLTLLLGSSTYFLTSCALEETSVKNSSSASSSASSPTSLSSRLTVGTVESSAITTTNETQPFEQSVTALTQQAQKVYYGVHYFNSGREFTSQNSAATASASVIKVFILSYALEQVAAGVLTEQTLIENKPLIEWLTPMIQQSDNQATNTLIDYFGMEPMNDYFNAQGYTETRLERKMLDTAARAAGKENYTSLTDCLVFLKRVYQQQDQPLYGKILALMEGQQVKTKIPSKLPTEILTANKTGELAEVENDIGLVFAPADPFAIVVLTNGIGTAGKVQSAIGDFALAAYQQSNV